MSHPGTVHSRHSLQERVRDTAHDALSALRAAAAVLPGGPQALGAHALRVLGPTPGRLEVDWSARPSREHPRPAVLVHGTNDTSAAWADAAATLREHGYVVFAPDYGREERSARGRAGGGGIGDITSSAREIARYVREVLRVTDASAVDLVGHSQGGLLAHLAAREADLPIDRLVTLGSTLSGAAPLGPLDSIAHTPLVATALDGILGPSARQQIRGSALLTRLAAEPETRDGITYTSIASRFDRTVRPVRAQHLAPGPGVHNVWLDDRDQVTHAQMPSHPAVIALLREALSG